MEDCYTKVVGFQLKLHKWYQIAQSITYYLSVSKLKEFWSENI